jgi:predicted nucleic acid-binding protein
MILVDTSVWIDHFRRGNIRLRELLEEGEVATHPMILGELACGNLPRRAETLRLLGRLPDILQAPDHLVLRSIDSHRLFGKGIGWIDAHLFTASRLSAVPLWTLDRRLVKLAGGAPFY